MKQKMKDWIEQYRYMDWAVLYLRLFIGGIIVLHNIGKVQDYNEIINSYPPLLGMSQSVAFTVVLVIQVALSVLIMIGRWVRPAAVVMALGMIFQFVVGLQAGEVQLLYLSIYVFLVVSGAGFYSFDAMSERSRPEKPTR